MIQFYEHVLYLIFLSNIRPNMLVYSVLPVTSQPRLGRGSKAPKRFGKKT